MDDKIKLEIVAILAITLIELAALYLGINGTMMTLAHVVIAGLAGYHVEGIVKKIKVSQTPPTNP